MATPFQIQTLLHSKLAELKGRNPAYSMRAFAKKLGLTPGALSLILNGRRGVSGKLARKICDALLLDPIERAAALGANEDRRRHPPLPAGLPLSPDERLLGYQRLTADQFHASSDWYHFAILSLTHLRDFKPSPTWIAGRLRITTSQAREALDRLLRLGMLVKEADGIVRKGAPKYATPDDIASVAARKAHFQNLELARQALEQLPVDRRDFTCLTLPMDPRFMGYVKQRARRFQAELDEELAAMGGELTQVYRLGVHFYPLTHDAESSPHAKPKKLRKPKKPKKEKREQS